MAPAHSDRPPFGSECDTGRRADDVEPRGPRVHGQSGRRRSRRGCWPRAGCRSCAGCSLAHATCRLLSRKRQVGPEWRPTRSKPRRRHDTRANDRVIILSTHVLLPEQRFVPAHAERHSESVLPFPKEMSGLREDHDGQQPLARSTATPGGRVTSRPSRSDGPIPVPRGPPGPLRSKARLAPERSETGGFMAARMMSRQGNRPPIRTPAADGVWFTSATET